MAKVVKRIPNRLRKHRTLMNYRQNEVATLLGFTNANRISRWEKGVSVPGLANLFKLSIIYRTFPNELYFDLFQQLRAEILNKEQHLKKKHK